MGATSDVLEYKPYNENENTQKTRQVGNARYGNDLNTIKAKDKSKEIPDLGLYRDDDPVSDNEEENNATLARLKVEKKILQDKQLSIQLQSKKGSTWRKSSQNSALNNS